MRGQTRSFYLVIGVMCGIYAIVGSSAGLAHAGGSRLESDSPGGKPGPDPGQAGSDRARVPAQEADRGRERTPKYPSSVGIALIGFPSQDVDLAREVEKVLSREQPENPGRRATFGTMFLRGLTPRNWETHVLKQVGWSLTITEVARNRDGWRATIRVQVAAMKRNYYPAAVMNWHIEEYSFRDGTLILESERVGPCPLVGPEYAEYNPSQGLIADPAVGEMPKQEIDPFGVQILLEGTPTEPEKALAKEVEKVLEEKRPENLGRDKTFVKMEFPGFGPDLKPQLWKMKRVGWTLTIRHVERIPGGWRATLHVHIRATSPEGIMPIISNHHIEVYTFRGGKLTLESESVDPKRDPAQGLGGAVM
jgi:hypothetical protein